MPETDWRFGVVGNIVRQHTDSEGVLRYGAKAFRSGTKVYIDAKDRDVGADCFNVIGLNRFNRVVLETIPASLIENVRVQQIFKPSVLALMDRLAWLDGWQWWGRTAADKRAAKAFADAWNALRGENAASREDGD